MGRKSVAGAFACALAAALAIVSVPVAAATGDISQFAIPTAAGRPSAITTGPDGNLWFTEDTTPGPDDNIGRLTPAGVFTAFSVPNSVPTGITAGPDGNLWFTENNTDKIGVMTTAGALTEYSVPTSGSGLSGITAGPDGNPWFVEGDINKIGVVTPPESIGNHLTRQDHA